jgi:eukaryotic-like serine/threonine-protein kinase
LLTLGGRTGVAAWSVPGFTELKTLGSGAFGEVVLARHDSSGTLVAIKYLRENLLWDAEFTELFRAEAAVLATVDDPHVVRVYEYVESRRGAAIVMELVDGVCLRDILVRQGKITAEAALVILMGSLLGLAAAHRRGVVHRAYKPENVLVNGDGDSKLTDFGIAARAGDSPISAGTMVYAPPPEQFGGAPASPASDVYAATATFYECLVGRPPFTGGTPERLLYQHLAEPIPLEPVPEPLRPLVAAGMAKDPSDRPADGRTFVAELKAIAAGAYGRDWYQRGRSDLGEAALLLAELWPAGAPPALRGRTVKRIFLFRRVRGLKVAIAVSGVAVVAAAGTALAVRGPAPRTPAHSVAAAHQISLQPSSPSASASASSSSSSSKPSATSLKITASSSPPTALTATTPPAQVPAPAVSATSNSSKPSPTPSVKPSPKPSPRPSPPASAAPSSSASPLSSQPPSSVSPFSSQPPQSSPPGS